METINQEKYSRIQGIGGTLLVSMRLLINPKEAVKDKRFADGTLWAVAAAYLPLMLVLALSGSLSENPSDPFAYTWVSALICGFSLLFCYIRSLLLTMLAGIDTHFSASLKKFIPLFVVMVLIETIANLALFLLKPVLPDITYTIAEEFYIFAEQFLFAVGAGYILIVRESVKINRSIISAAIYFVAACAWLLLPMLISI